MSNLRIAGVGCSLADFLYADVDFESEGFKKYLSKKPGDGGLNPGHLVFLDDLEKFAGEKFQTILRDIVGDKKPDTFNLGGPAVVAMINAAQLLSGKDIDVDFYGAAGKDETAEKIFSIIKQTPMNMDGYKQVEGMTPFTEVFSDPNHSGGKGERTFVNNVGAAWNYYPEDLDESFFSADIALFGATALVPRMHDGLTGLLRKARNSGCLNIVITVFDFRNENKTPDGRWPLGESDDSFKLTDLLVVDHVEALRISGKDNIQDATAFYREMGVSAFVITNGAKNITAFSDGRIFKPLELISLPVSAKVDRELQEHPERKGDTTGCGDNFAGGVLASVASQLEKNGRGSMDLVEACAWGAASGGFACFYVGGTFLEKEKGEKLERVGEYFADYASQIENMHKIDNRIL